MTRPRSAGVLATLTAVTFAATAGFLATDVGQVALVDQWERTALAFGRPVDDARYAEMQELSRYRVPYAAAVSVARGPVAAVAIAGVLYGLFRACVDVARASRQVLAVVAHAGVILALRDVVAAPLNYCVNRWPVRSRSSQFVGVLDEASPLARFFALFDVFVLWWIVVLAVGLAVLYRARARAVAAGATRRVRRNRRRSCRHHGRSRRKPLTGNP